MEITSVTHQPSQEMDARLLEATKEAAGIHLERHIKAKEKDNWIADDIITTDHLIKLLPFRNDVRLSPGVGESVEVFGLTEDGIPWFPRDVGNIFNPNGILPSGNDNDPHEAFPRYWSTEEFQHATISQTIARLLGRDMHQLEQDRQKVIRSGNVPHAKSSALGMAYTAFQEGNTADPYRVLVSKFKEHEVEATNAGQAEVAEIYQLVGLIYSKIAQDERLHKSFIAANVNAALQSGDTEVQQYMLSAIWDVLHDFTMPLQREIAMTPAGARRFVPIRKAGIFTVRTVQKSQSHTMKNIWKIDKISGLQGKAAELQDKLGELVVINDLIEAAA